MKEPVVKITLDLHKESVDTAVSLKHGDTVGRIAITLSEGGFPYEITEDCYAVLTAVKPDGNILYNRCEILGNTVFYEVTAQTTALVGRMPAEVKLYGGEDRLITSAAFRILVQEAVCTGEMVESTGEVSALTHLVSQTLDITRRSGELIDAAETAAQVVEQAAEHIEAAVQNANDAAARADQFLPVAQEASQKAEEASRNVNTLRIVETAGGEVVTVSDASDMELAGLRIFGKTTQNGTPTPEAPVPLDSVGDDGSVAVTVCGKNLFDVPYLAMNGTGNRNDNGTPSIVGGVLRITRANATGTSPKYFVNLGTATPFLGKTLYLKMKAKASTSVAKFGFGIGFYKEKNNTIKNTVYSKFPSDTTKQELSCTFIVPNTLDESNPNLGIVVYADNASSITTQAVGDYVDYWDIMVSFDDVAYVPYKEVQTLTISTPNGLPGIPVSSGGNYTDGNGQQWICDEVDFENGVYVQRILQNVFNGSENWADRTKEFTQKQDGQYRFNLNNPFSANYSKMDSKIDTTYGLSDWGSVKGLHGVANRSVDGFALYTAAQNLYVGYITTSKYSSLEELKSGLSNNPLTVLAILETPIETPLPAEQLAAFAVLHTSCPNTAVFTDEDAGMEVKYVADTKLYVDKKFDQLAAVLVNRT